MSGDAARHAQYTEAAGDGPLDLQVTLLAPGDGLRGWRGDSRNQVLAQLTGASFELRSRDPVDQWRIAVTGDAADFEHDTAKLAMISLAFVTPASAHSGRTAHLAVITALRLHPFGVDPLTVGDRDTPASMCDGWPGGSRHEPHPLVAYVPQERPETEALVGRTVVVESRPNERAVIGPATLRRVLESLAACGRTLGDVADHLGSTEGSLDDRLYSGRATDADLRAAAFLTGATATWLRTGYEPID